MPYDLLTTSGINTLVNNYKTSESQKRLGPLSVRKSRYENLDAAYTTITSRISSLVSILSTLKETDSASAFVDKTASSSNTNFVSVSASSSAVASSQSLRVNQLAKSDLVLSQDLTAADSSTQITEPGTHEFVVTSGDGEGGTFKSKVSVTFETADFTNGAITNKKVMEKIQSAISSDKAVVASSSITGSSVSAGSFKINLNGTETTINYSAGTYSAIMDSIVTQVNAISGLSAEKVTSGENVQLKITVSDSSKYISFGSDTSNLLSELGITSGKEKSAANLFSASSFSPASLKSQFSLTAKNSGYDYRILSLDDSGSGKVLSAIGLNLGSTRQAFVQNAGVDTAGYVHTSTTLNSKFEFNGISLERNSNTVSDLLDGVTFNLKAVMQNADASVNISVENDTSKIKEKVQTFVTKFNELYTYVKEKSSVSGTTRGLLVGDTTADSLLTLMRTIASGTVSGIDSKEIDTLSKLGITFSSTSGLSISNSTTLENAIKETPSQVEALFNSTNGIATKLYSRLNPYVGADGYITKSKSNLSSSIQSMADNISFQQTRIEKSAEILRNQYLKLQTQLATLLSNQGYFMSNSNQ